MGELGMVWNVRKSGRYPSHQLIPYKYKKTLLFHTFWWYIFMLIPDKFHSIFEFINTWKPSHKYIILHYLSVWNVGWFSYHVGCIVTMRTEEYMTTNRQQKVLDWWGSFDHLDKGPTTSVSREQSKFAQWGQTCWWNNLVCWVWTLFLSSACNLKFSLALALSISYYPNPSCPWAWWIGLVFWPLPSLGTMREADDILEGWQRMATVMVSSRILCYAILFLTISAH